MLNEKFKCQIPRPFLSVQSLPPEGRAACPPPAALLLLLPLQQRGHQPPPAHGSHCHISPPPSQRCSWLSTLSLSQSQDAALRPPGAISRMVTPHTSQPNHPNKGAPGDTQEKSVCCATCSCVLRAPARGALSSGAREGHCAPDLLLWLATLLAHTARCPLNYAQTRKI